MKWLLIGAAAAVIAVGGVLIWYRQEPPPAEPGTVRITNPQHAGVPPPQYPVTLSDGRRVILRLDQVTSGNGTVSARIGVTPRAPLDQTVPAAWLILHQGETRTVDGVTVHVVRIWQMPNPANQAVDVLVSD